MYYSTEIVTPHITCIRGAAGERCWLVEGEREAALIDCTCGHAGLRALVDSLTALPVTVLMTHGHRDHVGGASAFGRARLHPLDLPLVERGCDSGRRAEFVRGKAPEEWSRVTGADFPAGDIRWESLKEGERFDLGGTVLEVLHTPGHTAGSVCFLDRADGILFSGDICARRTLMMLPESQGLDVLEQTLCRLQKLEQRGIRQLIGHDPGMPGEHVLENLLDCIADIRAGTDDREPFESVSGAGWLARHTCDAVHQQRTDGKYGNIAYGERL